MKRRIPSPSMVVALTALAVALSGTAVAAQQALAPKNTVNTASIVNGSIRVVDINPATLKLLRGQKGDPGAQGPAGIPGSQGVPGAAGAAGGFNPAKIQAVESGDSVVSPNSAATANVQCPGGTAVISGGGFTNGPGLWMSRASGNGWVVGASGYTSISSTVRAYALCAAP